MRFEKKFGRVAFVNDGPLLILLYYKYTTIEDPETYAVEHRKLCSDLGLKGRILVAREGLNGTVSGSPEACQKYQEALAADPRTQDVHWKVDEATEHAFPRLMVKTREEVVSLGLGEEDFSPVDLTATHLSPKEWREAMQDPNAVLIDARNDYEWEVGRFENALLPPVKSFKELPKWVRENRDSLEGKKILTYCTGGIRCEKFSGFLLKEGFEDVFQLDGGIVTYGKDPEVKGEGYEGACYVFDERLTVPVNRTESASIVSKCVRCGTETLRYRNCGWKPCNEQILLCEICEEEKGRYCDVTCYEAAIVSRAGLVEP